jgi:hypothetical protein
VTRAEAKRRACAGAAMILGNGAEDGWLSAYETALDDGKTGALSMRDEGLMREAFDELIAELRRRAGNG